jgi:uncharacterized membrane protein YfcA
MDISHPPISFIILGLASFFAGAQNALAGGGSFVTFPALLLTGLDPRAANITSTVALFPGQITGGLAGRSLVQNVGNLPFWALMVISLAGGALGALLLLATPPAFFAALVPYLVLFATSVFAWDSFFRKPSTDSKPLPTRMAALVQFGISIYGGYFGGGIGFLMLATLTVAGVAIRNAGAMKNVLAGTMNASAVLVFLMSPDVAWSQAAVVAVTAMVGGLLGAWLLKRVNEKLLRGFVVLVGIALTIGMFLRS